MSETGGAEDPSFEEPPVLELTLPTSPLGRRLTDIRRDDVVKLKPLPAASSGGLTPAVKSQAPGLALRLKSAWAQFLLANQGNGLNEIRSEIQAHTPSSSQSLTFATIYTLPVNGKTTGDLKEIDWTYQWIVSPTATFKAVHAITGIDGSNETDSYRADLQLRW